MVTNAFNLIDGVDGLAGTVAIVAFCFLSGWFYLSQSFAYAVLCSGLAGATLGFLYYNWHKASIFMGDTGSLTLGFLLSVCVIAFLKQHESLPADNSSYTFRAPITIALTIALFPLFDTLRVFTLRLRQGRSPFSADKQHLHHLLLRFGLKHNQVSLAVGVAGALGLTATCVVARLVSDNLLIPVLVVFCLVLSIYLKRDLLKSYQRKRQDSKP